MTRVQQRHAFRLTALAAVLLGSITVLGGCSGSKSKVSIVSGKVTYKDAPVTGGILRFHPTSGGDPTEGPINADGTFSFGGIPVGPATVTVETDKMRKGETDYTKGRKTPEGYKPPEGAASAGVFVKIPVKYKDPKQSDLKVEVKPGKTEDIVLTLKD
jgi:hypothetical protein